MTLCALTFSNTSFIEEALKYLLRCQVVFGCGKPQEWITVDGD